MVILAVNWLACAVLSGFLFILSRHDPLQAFIKCFAVCCGAVVVAYLVKRDLISALLTLGGAVVLFSLTVILHSALLPPDVVPISG